MKNILICGVAKSGKSSLAKRINKNNDYNYIPLDYFTSSFKHNFPEIGITSNVIINKESSKKLSLFLSRIINIMNLTKNDNYIIDSAHLYPEDIIKYIDLDKWNVYFLGYSNISVEDKFNEIRTYIHHGWPQERTDEELKKTLKELINISKIIEEQCHKYHLNYIDTSNYNEFIKLNIKE